MAWTEQLCTNESPCSAYFLRVAMAAGLLVLPRSVMIQEPACHCACACEPEQVGSAMQISWFARRPMVTFGFSRGKSRPASSSALYAKVTSSD